jgi:hypothetical protein
MKDVAFLLHKGTYRFKALTPQAKQAFATMLSIPGTLVGEENAEIFLTGVKPENFDEWAEEMASRGLQVGDNSLPAPKPVEYAPGAAPWDV